MKLKILVVLLAVAVAGLILWSSRERQIARAEIAAVSNEVVTTQGELATTRTELKENQAQVQELHQRVAVLDTEKAKVEEEAGKLRESLAATEQRLTEEKQQLVAVTTEKERLLVELGVVSNQLTRVAGLLATLEKKIGRAHV